MARRSNQEIGTLGEPISHRLSTPVTLMGALRAIDEYDSDTINSQVDGALSTFDGRTFVKINPRLRTQLAPLVGVSPRHGPQLLVLNPLGRLALFATRAWASRPWRREIPF